MVGVQLRVRAGDSGRFQSRSHFNIESTSDSWVTSMAAARVLTSVRTDLSFASFTISMPALWWETAICRNITSTGLNSLVSATVDTGPVGAGTRPDPPEPQPVSRSTGSSRPPSTAIRRRKVVLPGWGPPAL
nr:hypothetical protein GCM10017745_28560 [Saccharothrix mutabilis subsp. capreolus]